MVEEAHLEALETGLAPVTDGWFVVNVRKAAWLANDAFGARCVFGGDTPVLRGRPDLDVHTFADVGFALKGRTRTAERDVPRGVEPGGLLVLAGSVYSSSRARNGLRGGRRSVRHLA